MTRHVIFYSWQADLPNSTNRTLIQTALENAVSAIATDLTIEPVIDRDTQGLPGSPDIITAILAKIGASDAVLSDITLVNPANTAKRTPNPNVLLELGYAFGTIGHERTILVMNTFYGPVTDLPFDLRQRRIMTYHSDPDDHERASARKQLASQLRDAIRAIVEVGPRSRRQPAMIATLSSLRENTHFYERVLSLIDSISQLPAHYITSVAKPEEYDRERRPLHDRFTQEYQAFSQRIIAARALLEQSPTENAGLLAAISDVTATVEELVGASRNRFDPVDRSRVTYHASEAARAATALSTLLAQRLVNLDATA